MTEEQQPPSEIEAPDVVYARIRPTMEKVIAIIEDELNDSDASLVLKLVFAKNTVRNGLIASAVITTLETELPAMMAMWRDAEQGGTQ